MKTSARDYSEYVEHPRFGRGPRYTHADPNPAKEWVVLSWWTILPKESDRLDRDPEDGCAIEGTAIPADIAAQRPMTNPFTHYFDVDRACRDCGKRFIFFADEQKYWYETLRFYVGVNCLHCIVCRKKRQHIDRARRRYQELTGLADLSPEQALELIESGVTLIDVGVAKDLCRNRLRHLARSLSPEFVATHNANDIIQRLWPNKGEQSAEHNRMG